ncbi:hypothetical protein Acr_00g0009240 [Actinidia rufa]|uniref:Uncharacterized protein n=1 Tax=Actinidia rufa TaxID=165716 RepID=A0A7J0D8T8_9ERIC|nr:hypothetical protein Acr_00g0009240 [Actinidia rufa]
MMALGPFPDIMGFNSRFGKRSDQCDAAIEAVNNCGRTWEVADLLNYVLVYRSVIPHWANRLGQVRLLALRIRERVVRRCTTSSEELSQELSENVRIAQALALDKQKSTPSTSSRHDPARCSGPHWRRVGGVRRSADNATCLEPPKSHGNWVRMKKYSSETKKALKKTNTLESGLKKVKEKLIVEEATRQASDDDDAKSKLEADIIQPGLQQHRRWRSRICLKLILLSFNEKEYMNQLAKEGDEKAIEVCGVGTSNELGAGGDTEGAGKGDQIIPRSVTCLYYLKGDDL